MHLPKADRAQREDGAREMLPPLIAAGIEEPAVAIHLVQRLRQSCTIVRLTAMGCSKDVRDAEGKAAQPRQSPSR